MRLLTLLAGYAAGLAVAMKYRKDSSTSKLEDTAVPTKTKLNSFIDEVVDIHKTAYADIKGFVSENFDDVENFDDLQRKVTGMISEFTEKLESHINQARETGISKKDELIKVAEDFYVSHKKTLDLAKSKASSFSGISEETIDSWLKKAQEELTSAYDLIQSEFSETISPDEAPVKKTPKKKTPKV